MGRAARRGAVRYTAVAGVGVAALSSLSFFYLFRVARIATAHTY